VFGVPTVISDCAAASVPNTGARCPATPECWAGLEARTFDQDIVEANRTVRAVCSMPVLLRSRRGQALRIPASKWDIEVLPPDEAAFDSGARAYRCVATVLGTAPSRSGFGS
jgi:hypothetical protein